MAKRDNHYEAAFEAYLRSLRIPYIAVDEAKRTLNVDHSLKSLDFIVSTHQGKLLVDVKGRKFPSGSQKQYWKNWSTAEDLESLAEWERLFGTGFQGVFVFAYNVLGDLAPVPCQQMFEFRNAWYGFVVITLHDYAAHAHTISPKWQTVAMPCDKFRQLATPLHSLLT